MSVSEPAFVDMYRPADVDHLLDHVNELREVAMGAMDLCRSMLEASDGTMDPEELDVAYCMLSDLEARIEPDA